MEGTELYSNAHCCITYDESNSMINFLWKDQRLFKDQFQEILVLYADLIEEHRPKRLFIDAIQQRFTLTQEVREWHDQTIIPRYHKAGVNKISFLVPQNIFSELTHKKTFEEGKAAELVNTEFFKDRDRAIDWLMDSY